MNLPDWVAAIPEIWNAIDGLVGVLGLAAGVFTIVYRRFETLYLWVNRWWLRIKNPSILWDVEIVFHGAHDDSAFDTVLNTIQAVLNQAHVLNRRETELVIQTAGIVVRAHLTQRNTGGRFGRLVVRFQDVRTNFRESGQLVSKITMIAEKLMVVRPSRVDHRSTVSFVSSNPYFGLYVQRVHPDAVEAFQCIFHPDEKDPGSTVMVGTDSVSLHSASMSRWADLSRKYLAVR